MKRNILIVVCLLTALTIQSQESNENKVKLDFYGFVKNDFFWDSRQTVSAREGHFLLWPAPVDKDHDGVDINATPNFNFLSIQSRVGVNASGLRALKADISARIEGDFFGQLNPNINLFRLRVAYINLKWKNNELRFGQDWIPMFITDCFPGTVSFNTGTPIQPFGRAPQIRFIQNMGKVRILASLVGQRDHADRGPLGPTSTYLRNTGTPEFSLQVHYKTQNNEKGTAFITGVGLAYKEIRPRLETDSGYYTDAGVGSMSAIAFMKYQARKFTVKLEGVYGQNIANDLSISGYVVSHIQDINKDIVKYSPMQTMSFWTDIHTNGKVWQFGIFAGYTQNIGATEDMASPTAPVYGLATDIANLYRISPRAIYNVNKLRFALELEYTAANYGANRESNGRPTDLTLADNFRTLFAVYYFF